MWIIIESIWFLMPAYVAILFPVLTKNISFLDKPVDLGKKFKGKRIFGKNKTYRGLFFGFLAGMIMTTIQIILFKYSIIQNLSWIDYSESGLLIGVLLSFGALLGDLVKSFFKRRLNIKPSEPWIFFDQADYIFGAILLVSIVYLPNWDRILILFITGIIIHFISVWISYLLGIKKHWI